MDYEEKYKEAIKRAKYYKEGITDRKLENGENIMDYIFPELKESEDEKIKKIITHELACLRASEENGSDRYEELTNAITWLEKQGDTYDYTRVDLSKFDDRIQEFSDMLEDKPKSYWDGFYEAMDWVRINGNPFKEKQGKQKSTKNIMNVWKDMRLEVYQQASGNRHEPNYSDDTTKMFSLNDIDEIIEKMSEQKPIISNNAIREGITHFGITQYQIDNWLKKYVDVETQSKLQYWKPSEEQLEALDYAYNSCPDTERGNYYEGVLRTLIDELYKLQEKQGNPMPADKVEIKQKPDIEKGKWYVCNTARYTDFVVGKAYYCPKNGMLKPDENEMARYVARNCFRLWTIQDAKDGDVLANNGNIIMFKEISNSARKDYKYIQSHCLVLVHSSYFYTGGSYNLDDGFHPATKEHRDLLFKKMHESGYEWDFEVKELNKIEKTPVWSEEEKQLLLKDLCARLPYKVRCKCVSGLGGGETEKGVLKYVGNCYGIISNYYESVPLHSGFVNNVFYPIENIKPYLRPMSSMTEEERKMVCTMNALSEAELDDRIKYRKMYVNSYNVETFDLFNSNHLDYRGLIPMGLAIKVTEENNPYKE